MQGPVQGEQVIRFDLRDNWEPMKNLMQGNNRIRLMLSKGYYEGIRRLWPWDKPAYRQTLTPAQRPAHRTGHGGAVQE